MLKKIIVVILIGFNFSIIAQQSRLSKNVNIISDYIASTTFKFIKNDIGDLASVDSIYIFSLENNFGDISESLLALTFATIPYRKFPITLPLVKIILYIPLVSADEQIFEKKNLNLPGNLFFDSPGGDYGDKDKLAHFFGSAFISYESRIFDLGKLIGYFVEAFEESFKVQSNIDQRDLEVNEYGRLFGNLLKSNKNILPSKLLLLRSLKYYNFIL